VTLRVTGEPAYVLHHYDWSESSVIVEAFTRHYGRIALVARGAKKPSSNFRPVLLPMQALLLTWSGDAEVRVLKGAEWGGGPVMPSNVRGGDALLAGYYANELLMRLLARDDPHPRLFDGYLLLMQTLANPRREALRESGSSPAALRAFELLLLREAGLLPALDAATLTLAPLVADAPYRLSPEGGLLSCDSGDAEMPALPGTAWLALEQALADVVPFSALLAAIESWVPRERAQLRHMLRAWLDLHCGSHALKTRQLLHDLRGL